MRHRPSLSGVLPLALLLGGCPTTVASQDGALDEPPDALDVATDVNEEDLNSPDRPPEDRSSPDAQPDVVESDRNDATACPSDPPSGPPTGTNRSCAAGSAPSWHCQEVHYCGATYQAGSLNAWYGSGYSPSLHIRAPMRPCDLHDGVVRTGYIDAHEVTVARFRAWVRAGRPHPENRADFFNGHPWNFNSDEPFGTPNTDDKIPGAPATRDMCTYSDTPGVHDDLPMNCMSPYHALAFCWWDGKHLATEVAWEYVGRNRGVSDAPWGPLPTPADTCTRGDVGAFNELCAREALPQAVNAFPSGATTDPAGVFGLYGGVGEIVLGYTGAYTRNLRADCKPLARTPAVVDGERLEGFMFHGTAWFMSAINHRFLVHSASRSILPGDNSSEGPRSPAIGFRCMRWVPEPRAP